MAARNRRGERRFFGSFFQKRTRFFLNLGGAQRKQRRSFDAEPVARGAKAACVRLRSHLLLSVFCLIARFRPAAIPPSVIAL
jgi:hypothetical protein